MAEKIQLDIKLNPELDVAKLNAILSALQQSMGKLGKDIKLIDAAKLKQETDALGDAARKIDDSIGETKKNLPLPQPFTENAFFKFNQMADAFERVAGVLNQVTQPAIQFEKSLDGVGAITGMTGDKLDELGEKARELATKFGTSATDQLASFQGVLSKLGPAVAEDAGALGTISDNINTLAKAGGIDAATSMDAVTTALLQLGLASGTPAEVAANSTDAINAIAAGAQVGAAEINQVAESFKQAGVAMKGANIDLVAGNAAIQVLALGGKTGSEAGIALRNVLGLLQKASGPAADELARLGTSSTELGNLLTTQGLDAAMAKVSAGMNNLGTDAEKNAALITIFGTENASAAGILMDNADKFKEFSDGIKAGMTGTGSAFEQASINMDNTATQIDIMDAKFNDILITIGSKIPSSLTTLAGFGGSIAPLATTFMALQSSIMPLAGNILQKLVPALFTFTTTTTASGAAATTASFSFAKFWAAATGPVGIAIAGIAALAAGVYILSDALTTTAAEKLADAEATEKVIDSNTKLQQKNIDVANSSISLAAEWEELGKKADKTAEEQKKFGEMTIELGKAYPGVIKSGADFATNLAAIQQATVGTKGDIEKFKVELEKLFEQKQDIINIKAQLTLDKTVEESKDEIEGIFTDFWSGTDFSGMIQAKKLAEAIQNAKTDQELIDAQMAMNDFINTYDMTPEQQAALSEETDKIVTAKTAAVASAAEREKQIKMKAERDAGKEIFNIVQLQNNMRISSLMPIDASLAKIAKQYGITKEAARALYEEQKKAGAQAVKNAVDVLKGLQAWSDKTLELAGKKKPADDKKKKSTGGGTKDLTFEQELSQLEALRLIKKTKEEIEDIDSKIVSLAKSEIGNIDLKIIKTKDLAAIEILNQKRIAAETYAAWYGKKEIGKKEIDIKIKVNDGADTAEDIKSSLLGEGGLSDLNAELSKQIGEPTFLDELYSYVIATSEQLEMVNQAFADSMINFGIAVGEGQKNAFGVLVKGALDLLKAMVPIWSAQILAGSLATPQSVISAGGWGLVQWAALTALIEGAIAAIPVPSFASGGYVDSPTYAVVGDAKKSGNSSNAELILNQTLFGDMVDSILGRYTLAMDKYFGQSVSGDNIDGILNSLNAAINGIKPFMKDFSVENLTELITTFSEQNYLDGLYNANELAIEEYADKMQSVQLRMSRLTTAPVSDFSLLGTKALRQTEILNDNGLRAAVYDSANFVVKRLEKKFDEQTTEIVGALHSFDGRLHVIESEAAKSVNHYNNKNSATFKTRRFPSH